MRNNLADNEKAVWILKTKGPQPLTAIAREMKVTTEGARFHLLKLANEGLVKASSEPKGRGRPQQIWSLTQIGHERFPDTHAELTVKLITMMRENLGEGAVQTVVDANEHECIQRYTHELGACTSLESKINKLAEVRSKEGYMAEYTKEEDGFLFIENHCPIFAAARMCQGFCRAELNTFRAVLGKEVTIHRVDHILNGARRCAYKISPVKK